MAAMAAKVAKVARVVRVDRGDGVPVLLPHEVKESDHDVDHTPGGLSWIPRARNCDVHLVPMQDL